MSYSLAYHLGLQEAVDPYSSDCCFPTEYGRVRSVAFIRKRYLQQIFSDPTDIEAWQTGILNEDIIIMPLTTGQFDSGQHKQYKGYGRRLSTHGLREMQLNFQVPALKSNYAYLNNLDKRLDYVPCFRTSSWLHLCDVPADLLTREIVPEDLEESVEWSIEAVIKSRSLPIKIDDETVLALFGCSVDPEDPSVPGTQIVSDWWETTADGTFVSGASEIWNYNVSEIVELLAVKREGTGWEIVTGAPGAREVKHNAALDRVEFSADYPFNEGERVFLMFKK